MRQAAGMVALQLGIVSGGASAQAGFLQLVPGPHAVGFESRDLFDHPPEMRRLLYTTNAIESPHMQLRKILEIRGHFPSDGAAIRRRYLAWRTIVRRWKAAPRDWKAAMNQLAILHPGRFAVAG